MSEIELHDALLRNSLQILRLSAGEQAVMDEVLRQLERDLKALLATRSLSDASRQEVQRLIADAGRVIDGGYAVAGAQVDTRALALVVAEQTADLIGEAFTADILRPTEATLASLTRDVLIEGAPTSAWWARQAEDTAFRFAAQVRQGVANGETTERIVGRIVGRRPRGDEPGDPGFMDTTRRNARALVHSSVLNAASVARFETFRKNPRLFKGVRWLATLDMNTCRQCGALDGQTWDFDGKKLPGTTIAFRLPLAHWNCRCTITPALRREGGPDRRASQFGQISGDTSFDAFLGRMTPEQVEQSLGTRRAELYKAGKITIRDLVSGTGRELTLDELRIRNP